MHVNYVPPLDGESIEQYTYRLSKDKQEYKVSWRQISELIFAHFGKRITSDFVRHEWYGMQKRDYVEIKKEDGYIKVLILFDLHIPYQRNDVLSIIEDNKDVDYIIFGGDLIDCKSCSFWDDFNKPSVEEELILAHEFICKVNKIVNPEKTKLLAIRGNHEFRYTRDVIKLQEKQLQKLLNPRLLSMLEKGFTYYDEDVDITYKSISNFTYIDNWYIKLFENLIVAHPIDFSPVDGKMCESVGQYFLNEHIATQDDIIMFGHTHKYSTMKVNRRQGVFVIEGGCLCLPQNYAKNGKLKYTPQNYCYINLKFKNGEKININNVTTTHLI